MYGTNDFAFITPRFHLEADTISIAFVIWLVFFVETIRDFISRNDAISSHHPYSRLIDLYSRSSEASSFKSSSSLDLKSYSDTAKVFLNSLIAAAMSASAGR